MRQSPRFQPGPSHHFYITSKQEAMPQTLLIKISLLIHLQDIHPILLINYQIKSVIRLQFCEPVILLTILYTSTRISSDLIIKYHIKVAISLQFCLKYCSSLLTCLQEVHPTLLIRYHIKVTLIVLFRGPVIRPITLNSSTSSTLDFTNKISNQSGNKSPIIWAFNIVKHF